MPKFQFAEVENKNPNFKQLLVRYVSSWPLFIIMLILSFLVAWIYLHYTVPVYESKATIQIKDDKKGGEDSKMLATLDLFSTNKIVENEIEVLRSGTLMKEVVKKLSLYAPVTQEGKFHDLSAYTVSPITVELKDPDHFKEQQKIPFEYDGQRKCVLIDNKAYFLNVWNDSKWGLLMFTPNRRYDSSLGKKKLHFSLIPVARIADGVLGGLDVSSVSKLSTIVTLTLKDQAPQRSEDILNAVITEYNQSAIRYKNMLAENAIAFVEQRLHYVVEELDSVETQIQKYKTVKGVIDISEQGKLFLASVESNDQKISEIDIQLAVLDQVQRFLRTNEEKPGIAPSTLGLKDGALSGLLMRLYDAQIEYERLKRTTAENNSILVSVQNQIGMIKANIVENVQNQQNNLLASKRNLTETSGHYSSMLRSIPEKERQLLDITRQQSIKNNIYVFLLQKREEAALSSASSVVDSRLIDSAHSGWSPVSPSSTKIYAMAFILGLGIPIGFITLKDLLNQTIQSRSDIQATCSFPVLGEINYDNSRDPFILINREVSYVAEQIRQIRSSLSYLGICPEANKILITSSVAGEGKTFIAINLATSLALTDKRVVLVELDLRRPCLSQIFKIKTYSGISNYLKRTSDVDQIIYPTFIHNLSLIPSGEIPSHPSELISNGKLDELLSHLQKTFDYIIIETAPVHLISDAYIASKSCNATLFIARHNKTTWEDMHSLQSTQEIRSFPNMGIILNGVKPLTFFPRKNYKYYASSKSN